MTGERNPWSGLVVALVPPPNTLAPYRDNPAAFAADLIDWPTGQSLTAYQAEVLEELPMRGRVAVRGPHGLGKTTLEAIAVLWFALTRDGGDWKAATTASAWHQLTHYTWPEIRRWSQRIRWAKVGRDPFTRAELLDLTLKLRTGSAFSASPVDPAKIEGAHADNLLYAFDEAKSIPGSIFDAVEGAFSGAGPDTAAEAFALAVSTPGEPSGPFYAIHARQPGYENWWARHVSLSEAIAAGRISAEWAEQRKRQWGEGSAIYANRVLGEFATSDQDGVIPLAWVEAAVERWRERYEPVRGHAVHWEPPQDLTALGVDVARSGGDKTVVARRFGSTIAPLEYLRRSMDTMESAGRIVGILEANTGVAVIDVIGIGAGVVDRVREQVRSSRVEPFNASEATPRKDRSGELGFINKRAAAWWHLREMLDPNSDEEPVLLPPDEFLAGDLTAPHWWVTSTGKVQIESKDEVRRRLGRSTDSADAVMQAFWPIPRRVHHGWSSAQTLERLTVGTPEPW